MTMRDYGELLAFTLLLAVSAKPLGIYLERVFNGERVFLTPVLRWLEQGIYRVTGIDADEDQHWTKYSGRLLVFSAVTLFFTYALLRLQGVLPLNPRHYPGLSP